MLHGLSHLGWNLFLAVLGVALAQALAAMVRAHRKRGDAALAVPLALLGLVWLLVLPNTCYLFTEVRHLFDAIEHQDLWSRAHRSTWAQVTLAMRGAVLAIYGVSGALTFGLSIRIVREAVEDAGVRTRRFLPVFFVLVALGVHLGLVMRLNSWDVLTRPMDVLASVLRIVSGRRRVLALVLGGGLLWTVYAIVDVWIDGARLRWARLRTERASLETS